MYAPTPTPGRTLPVHTTPERPVMRHPSARNYAHRVRESLTTRISKIICGIILSFLLIIGLIFFILFLSLTPHRPRFYVQDFSVPGLAQAQPTGLENAQISFNVTVRNSNQHIHIFYDTMVATVYYQDQSVGSTTVSPPFEQQPKTTSFVSGTLSGATLNVNNSKWAEFQNDRQQGTVVFRLRITSTVRFKVHTWDSKIHKVHVDCDVAVDANGLIMAVSRNKKCRVYFI